MYLPRLIRFSSRIALLCSCIALLSLDSIESFSAEPAVDEGIRVMTWNIWHGGREDGEEAGPKRVVEVIKESQADIIAMQETYGTGERISKELGFHFQERGTNLSIHSRFPIVEDISVFATFKCTGALIDCPGNQRIAFYCVWLPYGEDIWIPDTRKEASTTAWLAACRPSAEDLQAIEQAIGQRLADPKYQDVSIVIAGDFNSMSHIDYTPLAADQYLRPIAWETSQVLSMRGFRDAYRESHPVIDRQADATWSPRFPDQEQDRIDYVYYRSNSLRAVDSIVIREHHSGFPSDHAAVVTTLADRTSEIDETSSDLNVVSYNIKHGVGNDGQLDLARSAKVLEALGADFIGLQEIDWNARRSNRVNQMQELSRRLGMHAAFGAFMDFQGGQYGLGILSRHPILESQSIRLPDGNEPRVALAVKVRLPDDRVLMVVNLHFDWVGDDGFRFAQATELKTFLDQLTIPYLLMGDFNDGPDSRTLELFRGELLEAEKPVGAQATFPATGPKIEIDYIFAAPASAWKLLKTEVIAEPLASDHCPIRSRLRLNIPDSD